MCGCGDDWIAHPLNRHHLIPRGHGDDIDANIIPLCGSGTSGCHGLVEAHDPATCRLVRQRLQPDELAYCVRMVGQDRFDRRYPA